MKNELSRLANELPKEEKFRLTNQIIRASRSITNNIADGYGRFYYQENIQFLRQARGSIYECIDHLYSCLDDEYIDNEKFSKLKNSCSDCLKILNGYINQLTN